MSENTLNPASLGASFWSNFLGHSPEWYKRTILGFLILNPILLFVAGPYITGWAVVLEFIFTLAMALKCYPLQPGGLIAIEALFLGLADPHTYEHEVDSAIQVILLLIFMVAGVYFMKDLLMFTFTKLLTKVRNKVVLSLLFSIAAAVLSAFLDALTVTAVIITVAVGFYFVYVRVVGGSEDEADVPEENQAEFEQFRAFLRSLMMHAAVGTALGGVMTTVGEPQNLLISTRLEWDFVEFFLRMAPITIPVFFVGITTCVLLELSGILGYGTKIPPTVMKMLEDYDTDQTAARTRLEVAKLITQALTAVFLVIALGFHLVYVGLIGLAIIVLQTAFNGVVEEHDLGPAFEEALPFTALLGVFFAIVAVIADQQLFQPVIEWVLSLPIDQQPGMFYIANGVLSAISDNVFVATVYIGEVHKAFNAGIITREQFDLLGVAINTGTNIPSVATPNGQAAFLFLLTSSLAPLIRLSYGRMVVMALPYTITMGIAGWLCVLYIL